jgi:hypothetical protein
MKTVKLRKIESGEYARKIGCFEGENLVGVMEETDVLVFLSEAGLRGKTLENLKMMLAAAQA